jgi:hypothetical protein
MGAALDAEGATEVGVGGDAHDVNTAAAPIEPKATTSRLTHKRFDITLVSCSSNVFN